ncbi:hypothetical protein [Halomontanus rarus]|uniref:hypothetical protein n=1 Tax=Halomontanus rarus TaxID=3034020 RepID=UPI0023E81142|nr:hypothetical protein [Halovivax sp. TS33]
MTGGFDVRWTPERGAPRALLFEPAETDWIRTEFEWTGEEWRELGCERVTEIACFGSDGEYVAPSPRVRAVRNGDAAGGETETSARDTNGRENKTESESPEESDHQDRHLQNPTPTRGGDGNV